MVKATDIRVPWEEIRKNKIFIATPMYGGQCYGGYANAVIELASACKESGVGYQCFFLFNESLIQRGRNYLVDEFLRSECTHMLFIDADIVFKPQDVFTMLATMMIEKDIDVLCGPYPKKTISWEKIVLAVNKGYADSDPSRLEDFVGDFVFNLPAGSTGFPLDEPAEVLEAGTGFMMIKREVFDRYREAYPHLSFKPDHVRSEKWDGSREIHAYFDCIICPDTKRYLSEDYFFCQNVRKMGGKVCILPWVDLIHIGTYGFSGKLAAISAVGAPPTVDTRMIGKFK